MVRDSLGGIAAVVVTILLISGAAGAGVGLGSGNEAVSEFVGTASAQQSTHVQVEHPTTDNVDQDGNTGADESADGDDVYGSIQAGVGNASDTARIEVAPGTYRENYVTIAKNVTLVATGGPDRTVLDGSQFTSTVAVEIEGTAAPVVDGFNFTGYEGVLQASGSGDWTVRNSRFEDNNRSPVVSVYNSSGAWIVRDSTFENNGGAAISASDSSGSWTVRNTTFENNREGISGGEVSGDWTVRNSTFANNGYGIDLFNSSSDWTVRTSTFENSRAQGIEAFKSSGDWTVRNSTFRDNDDAGVAATESSGEWTVRTSTFENNGLAISGFNTTGAWEVHRNTITNNANFGVNAFRAAPRGNATHNYWGQASRPIADQCVGNVTCTPALLSPPGTDTDRSKQPNIQVENPARDNVDRDGNTGASETTDGDGVYGSIQAGVDSTTASGRVEVAPGTYRVPEVKVTKNVTLIGTGGPDRTVLNGSQFSSAAAVVIGEDAAPVIAGLSFADHDIGVDTSGSSGNWTVRDSSFRSNRLGVNAYESSSNWTVRNSTFRNNDEFGVSAVISSGEWTIRNSTFQNNERDGVVASSSSGNWAIRNSRFQTNEFAGVMAKNSSGEWTVRNSAFRGNKREGVESSDTSGDWTVLNSTFQNNDIGVEARNTNGMWEVHDSTIVNHSIGITADTATPWGNATHNYWGQASGPKASQCNGNVTCTPALSSPPGNETDEGEQPGPDIPGVSAETAAALAGSDGTVGRQDVLDAVGAYLGDQPRNGVTLSRSNVLAAVQHYLTG
jgi:hypothetical protein